MIGSRTRRRWGCDVGYSLYDFQETIDRVGISPDDIAIVIRAWSEGLEGTYEEWSGGFLLEMKAGGVKYVEGWCDTTGWGCQDGVDIFDADSEWRSALHCGDKPRPHSTWDEEPADLNRWIKLPAEQREAEKWG